MLVMADAYGADIRLVAFMQYLRVVFVAAAASLVARYWAGIDGPGPEIVWFGPIHPVPFLETLAVAVVGGFLGKWLRMPAGVFLVPFLLGSVLSVTGMLVIEIPEWLLAISYAMLGWNIGLGFTRPILAHARRALLPTIVSILVLMSFSGLLAFILVRAVGIDPLDRLSRHQPRRHGFDRHHRRLQQCRRTLRHGAADGAAAARHGCRSVARPLRCLEGDTAAISFSEMPGIRSGPDVSYVRTG